MPDENMTFTQVWNTVEPITVTFDANDGTVDNQSISVKKNGTLYFLPIPTRTGFKFDGWFASATPTENEQPITTDTTVSKTTTYYAKWTEYQYDISFRIGVRKKTTHYYCTQPANDESPYLLPANGIYVSSTAGET